MSNDKSIVYCKFSGLFPLDLYDLLKWERGGDFIAWL